MTKKITSFTHHTTGEGERITFTYSIIDENGNVTKSNQRATVVIVDDSILQDINIINTFLTDKIPE